MERIAFIIGHHYIYWNSILMALASAAAVCTFLALYLRQEKRGCAAALFVPLAVGASLVLSRLVCWYFRPESYTDFGTVLNLSVPGGSALAGVFAGCFLAALLVRGLSMMDDLPELMDCLCLAGGVGIALGRLSSLFDASDRGMQVPTGWGMPWANVVINPVSGAQECRLATFLLQAMAAGGITLVLLMLYLTKKDHRKSGDTALIFILCYGASQVLLDSTRYDSMYFRSNGFIRIVQVLGACGIVLAAVAFSCRLVRQRGWKGWYWLLWAGLAAMLGLAGSMEYFVQRWSGRLLLGYSIMALALLGAVVMTLVIRALAEKRWFLWKS